MSKINKELRERVIEFLAEFHAENWDYSFSTAIDIIKDGYKGLNDLSDDELFEELSSYFGDEGMMAGETGQVGYKLWKEVEAEIATHNACTTQV